MQRAARAARAAGRRGRGGASALVDRAERLLRAHLHDGLGVADLARELGTDRFRLHRAFRARHGQSVAAWSRARRLEAFVDLVRTADRPLGDLALEAGYADQSHATRACTRVLGRSPARLRCT